MNNQETSGEESKQQVQSSDGSKQQVQSSDGSKQSGTDDMRLYNLKYIIDPYGFRNIGASCYFNAMLQGVLGCSAFMETMMRNRDKPEYKENKISAFLTNTYDKIFDPEIPEKEKKKICSEMGPTIWRIVFKYTRSRMERSSVRLGRGQECAREGFHLFLESMDNLKEIQGLFLHRYRTLIYCIDCDKWVSDTKCEYILFEIPMDLKSPQLPQFEKIDPNYNKSRPLNNFLLRQNSFVDEDYRCPECNKKESRYKVTQLLMIPEIIVVVPQKWNTIIRENRFTAQKNESKIDFPEHMEFKGSRSKSSLNYRAVSVVEHMGGMNGGHYTCHSKRRDSNWYNLNDSNVSPSNFEPNNNTFIVFYHHQ